jgi:hypothetical protein
MLSMKDLLKDLSLEKNKSLPIWSDGDFSMHELLERLLQITGPATVRVSSFSVTEVAVRTFLRLQDEGLMKSLTCLFDLTVKQHRIGLLFFAKNVVAEIRLTKNHAKMIFIENDEWKVVLIGSANFNVNDKKEAAIISTIDCIYQKLSNVYDMWFKDSMPVTNELF